MSCSPRKISVADPEPGSGAFLTPGSVNRMGKKSGSGSGMNNPDHISESSKNYLMGQNTCILLFGSGIRNGKNSFPGSGINIPDPHHWGKWTLDKELEFEGF
jgi:hypothetical protein